MIEVNVKEARNNLKELLDRAERGEKIFVSRHGKKVACLVSPETSAHLPSLKKFRDSLVVRGEAMSDVLLRLRGGERY